MLIIKQGAEPGALRWLLPVAALLAAGMLYWFLRSTPPARPIPDGFLEKNKASEYLIFQREGLPGRMAEEVERVVRPRFSSAALCEKPGGRFACVLVESPGPEKYFELDRDLNANQFPFLKENDFAPPPFQVSRSMSTYRSVAKMAMKYDDFRDRMIVLVCPKSEWHDVRITCPELTPTGRVTK